MPDNVLIQSLTTRAEFDSSSINVEDRTVDVVFTTGQSGLREAYIDHDWRTFNEELDVTTNSIRTERLDKGLSLLDSHNRYSGISGVLGITRDYTIENGQIRGTVKFSKRAEEIWQDVLDGIVRHFSLGYKTHAYQVTRATGDDKYDTYRAVDWEPVELSVVPVSFETENGIRSETPTNTVEIEFLNQPKEDSRAMPDEILNQEGDNQRSAPPAQAPAVAPVVAPTIDAGTIKQDEAKRMEGIKAITRQAGMEDSEAMDHFIAGRSIQEVKDLAFDKLTADDKERNMPNVGTSDNMRTVDDGSEARKTLQEAMTSAILMRSHGEGDIAGKFSEMSDLARGLTSRTMTELARKSLGNEGEDIHSKHDLFSRAFNTTSDFPIALKAAVNKSLRGSYEEIAQTFAPLGRRTTVNDFKAKSIIQMGDMPDLKKLNEHGEFERSTLSESGESYSISTAGRILGISRQALINDDLGVFQMMTQWGASARRFQSDKVWGALLGWDFDKNAAKAYLMADGVEFWHSDHGNVLTGAGSALSLTSLAAARTMGRKAKTKDGNRMNLDYTYIVVPPELETLANTLLVQTIAATNVNEVNQFQGRYQIIVEPRLSDTTSGAQRWYLFSGNERVPVFEYAFLAGEEELNIETRHGFDVDGMEIRARTDFGVGLVDPMGGIRSTGAA
jgi:phage major head subunit gpT-like protein